MTASQDFLLFFFVQHIYSPFRREKIMHKFAYSDTLDKPSQVEITLVNSKFSFGMRCGALHVVLSADFENVISFFLSGSVFLMR